MTWLAAHLKEILHDAVHVVFMPAAVWLWHERRILKEVLEDGLERRHENKGDPMLNPITILNDVNLAVSIVEKLKAAIPQAQKIVADIKQAQADKNDTVKLYADLEVVLNDVETGLQELSTVIPEKPVTPAA